MLYLVSKCMAHMGKNQEGKICGQKSCDTLPLNTFLCQFSVQFNWQVLIFNQSKSTHNINSLNLKVENVQQKISNMVNKNKQFANGIRCKCKGFRQHSRLYIYFLIFRVLDSSILIFQTMNPCSIFYQLPESFFFVKNLFTKEYFIWLILRIESWTFHLMYNHLRLCQVGNVSYRRNTEGNLGHSQHLEG